MVDMKSALHANNGASRSVTMKDIGARCGVCKQTVSRAFRGDPKVSKAKTAEILAVAAELGYDISQQHAARRMAMQKHGIEIPNQVIAYFCTATPDPDKYLDDMLWGVWDTVTSQGYGLLLVDMTKTFPPSLTRGEVDAAILLGLGFMDHLCAQLNALRQGTRFGDRPVVSVLTPLPGCSHVLMDDVLGAELAAGHLLDLGHRRILHFYDAASTDYISLQRLAGYAQACVARGIDPAQVLIPGTWVREEVGYRAATAWTLEYLHRHPAITAILARHDSFALELLTRLPQDGIRVPDDLSVVGFDDTRSFLDASGQNMLTTVRSPLLALGRHAAQLAVQRVTHRVTEDISLTLPPELVVRGSTAPPRPSP